MPRSISLTGNNLNISDIYAIAREPAVSVSVSEASLRATEKARTALEEASTSRIIYGVNTGFGPMASHIIGKKGLTALQYNLIRSHAVGMGNPVDPSAVLAAMVVRLNTLAKGPSAVSPALLKHLEAFINARIIPVVPEHGAVGTSGDLVQLAHIALALIGEGDVFLDGERVSAREALDIHGLSPHVLLPKEGLSLINGTSMMSGIASLAVMHAQRLTSLAVRTGAWALELVHSFDDGISEQLHRLRPHRGQMAIAQALRDVVASSRLMRKRGALQAKHRVTDETHEIPEDVQEIYSFRCIPQILGPVLDTVLNAQRTVQTEINSVTDNPVLDHGVFLHGGNFHGEYVAMAVDELKASLTKLAMLSERRINFFMHQRINRRFPPFLNLKKPGLTLGLQGLQFVATSTAAQNQSLAFPHRVHSIPTNADNQDIVSMGTDAALMAMKIIDNAYIVLAIELIALAQASDVNGSRRKLSESSQMLYRQVRSRMATIVEDRVLTEELPLIVEFAQHDPEIPMHWHIRTDVEL